jgi:hypothetical protein
VTSALLAAQPAPDVARRTWPRYAALGVALIAVAVAGALWPAGGARLLLGGLGMFLIGRGVVLLRGARTGALEGELRERAGRLGPVAAGVGALALVAALVPGGVAAAVLLVGVPVLLLGTALALLTRGGAARRGGWALLVWTLLVTGVLVATGLGQDWARAADVARIAAAFAVAVLGVPMLLVAAGLRTVAAQPAPEPEPAPAPAATRPAGCAGCACGAGGCGAG